MTTRTAVLDTDVAAQTLKVSVQRSPVDFQNLSEAVGQRITATLERSPRGCHYFNPAVTVSCPEPTPEFFAMLRKEQARWCRQAGKTFPRKVRRSPARWISGGHWVSDKHARYLDRALCFTGALFIEGQFIASHRWPNSVGIFRHERRNGMYPAAIEPHTESNP